MPGLLAIFAEGGFKALFAELWSRYFGKKKDPETVRAENQRDQAIHAEEAFAAPDRDKQRVLDAYRLHAKD